MKLDWLLYAACITTLVVVTGKWSERSDAPPAPPPPGIGEMSLFANFTPFSAASIINLPVDDQKIMRGTAFSVSQSGEWIMARDSIAGCTHPFLNIGGNLGVPLKLQETPNATTPAGVPAGVYVIAVTEGGARPLPLADPEAVLPGVRGFMPGFPAGQVGEATARLIGKTVIEGSKRFERNEPVLAWAQAGRTVGLKGDLNQLIGGPVIDDNSRVMGVVLREKPRRGRIYTSIPQTVDALANVPDRKADFESEATITKRNYGIVSDTLRREYRVAQVGCIKS